MALAFYPKPHTIFFIFYHFFTILPTMLLLLIKTKASVFMM